jgi:hypothetical protein
LQENILSPVSGNIFYDRFGIIMCKVLIFQTYLQVNRKITAKTPACTNATVRLLLFVDGKVKSMPGVKRKNRIVIYKVKTQFILYIIYIILFFKIV